MAEISFVLPALNEGRSIGKVLDRIPVGDLERRGYDVNVWVLDGRSVDRTVEVAVAKGANIMLQKGRGKGRAVSQAFDVLRSDLVVMLDADNTYDPRDVIPMLPLLENGHDVVMGSRLRGEMHDGAMTVKHRLGNRMISLVASVMFRQPVSDLCTGFWGFKGHVLKKLGVDAKGFELEAQMFSRCRKKGLVIGEVPISYGSRGPDGTKLRSMTAGTRILIELFREFIDQPGRRERDVVTTSSAHTHPGKHVDSAAARFSPEME